ncbi:MAG: bifunctional diaminohydroxyphosphoribosylaminopyrimidine deaminase/5-amino-6-(5-phosphoribosylamino)uracil reductase RibD [Saprospiraceae bacterium]
MNANDLIYFMQAAIEEGKKALPHCLPNPPVGCVIVKDGQIIARGHTNPPGEDHAEAMALKAIPDSTKDISLFVTLEPCSFQGRTPSCAKTILTKSVKAVYVGIIDPHPKNQGRGIAILRAGGIDVHIGLLHTEIEADLNPYLIRSA